MKKIVIGWLVIVLGWFIFVLLLVFSDIRQHLLLTKGSCEELYKGCTSPDKDVR